ncbi:carboxymuconolactone decarboxylase family protein [Nitrospinota bacterium]
MVDRVERGKEIQRASLGKAAAEIMEFWNEISPVHAHSIYEYGWGTVWDQPLLDRKTRELIVLAAKAAQDVPGEVEFSVRGAMNTGATPDEVIEAIVQCCPYIGFPKTNHALRVAKRVIHQWDEHDEWTP